MSAAAVNPAVGFLSPDTRLAARARKGDTRGLALEAAKTLVSEGLVKPVFAELREGGFAAEGFKPGAAERRFRPMFDAMLADKVVDGSHFDLVARTADSFEKSIAHKSAARHAGGGAR